MEERFRITLAQTAPELLDIPHNTQRAAEALERAAERGSSLVVFPEMHLSGYGLEKARLPMSSRAALARDVARALEGLAERGKQLGLDYLMSYPLFEDHGLFIAAAYVEQGRLRAVHRKLNLVNYGHYTEDRNFDPGHHFTVVPTRLGTMGILICEDLWHPVNAAVCAAHGMEILLAPSAPCVPDPSRATANMADWKILLRGTAFSLTTYVLCATRGGREGDLAFDGGAFALSPEGEVLLELPPLEEAEGDVDIDRHALAALRRRRPLLANERHDLYAAAFGDLVSSERPCTPA